MESRLSKLLESTRSVGLQVGRSLESIAID